MKGTVLFSVVFLTGCAFQQMPEQNYEAFGLRYAAYDYCAKTNQIPQYVAQEGRSYLNRRVSGWRYDKERLKQRINYYWEMAHRRMAISPDSCQMVMNEVLADSAKSARVQTQMAQPAYSPAPVQVPSIGPAPTLEMPRPGYSTTLENTPGGLKQTRCTTTSSGVNYCF